MLKHIRTLIEPMICLCTGHLTQETCNALSEVSGDPSWPILYPNEYGAFVHVNDDPNEAHNDGPEDLAKVIDFARRQGIAWIKFDPDGNELDELPTYDWSL